MRSSMHMRLNKTVKKHERDNKMKMTKHKILSMLLIAALALTVIAGCSPGGGGDATTPPTNTPNGNGSESTTETPKPTPAPAPEETPEPTPEQPTKPTKDSKQGDLVIFGEFVWLVLDVRDGKALLLSEEIIERRPFHPQVDVGEVSIAIWADSDMRDYLNSTFFNTFSDEEKASIAETTLINDENQWYDWWGGSVYPDVITDSTIDMIFLLSVEEIVSLFGDSGQLTRGPLHDSDYYIDDQFNEARIALDSDGKASWWYLRTPGASTRYAISVDYDGRVIMQGSSIDHDNGGVRPALWMTLG